MSLTLRCHSLTNLGMAYRIPPNTDGSEAELVPGTQLENNLILIDKSTNTMLGQQINGVNEPALKASLQSNSKNPTRKILRLC